MDDLRFGDRIQIAGATLDEPNNINHYAFKHKKIGYEHFKAAAEVMKKEILRR